jgi:hypothetical protein
MGHIDFPDIDKDPDEGCQICDGLGEVWKYFKNDEQKYVRQPYAYCPQCFPEFHVPLSANDNEVEIGYQEANRLHITAGYIWD